MTVSHVFGENVGDIMLYAISTCPWCRKTKKLLDDLGVAYDYVYIDNLSGNEREEIMREVANYNPSRSFPTIIINNERCIIGYKENEIRRAVGK